jgi:hypothetical protein
MEIVEDFGLVVEVYLVQKVSYIDVHTVAVGENVGQQF